MAYPGKTDLQSPPPYVPDRGPPYPYPPGPEAYQPPPASYPHPQGAYPPPQVTYQPAAAYPAPQAAPTTITVITGGIINPVGVGPEPTRTRCPTCNETVLTTVTYESSKSTYLWSAVLCLLAWPCCCCFVPLCTNSTKTAFHKCPKCNTLIGIFQR